MEYGEYEVFESVYDTGESGYSIYDNGEYICTTIDKETANQIIKLMDRVVAQKIFRHPWNGIHGRPYDLCPECEGMCYDNQKYCNSCGQRLDWK